MSQRPPLRFYAEAVTALLAARASTLLTSSRSHFASTSSGNPASAQEIALIRRTIAAASRRLPFRTLCYEQALAARAMLRHRGRTSTLHFGSGRRTGALTAHVWASSGDAIVVGEQEAARHVELARSE